MPTDSPSGPGSDTPRRVVVKFRDPVILPYEDGAEQHVLRLRVGPWSELAQRFKGIGLDRLFTAASPEQIGELVSLASARDHRYRAPNLLSYFVIDAPAGVNPDELATALREWAQVELAYVDPLDASPAPPSTNDEYAAQTYLKPPATAGPPSPQGAIDAEFAWNQPGGTGVGQKIVDLERGARLNHDDLVDRNVLQVDGVGGANDPDVRHQRHGASVLGIVAAVDNDKGVIGIAHGVAEVAYISQVLAGGGVDRPDAVLRVIEHFMQPGAQQAFGRVLLLEVQLGPQNDLSAITDVHGVVWNNMPMETAPADFEMIRLATALGIVVVEPTGNGHHDLDLFQAAPDGKFVLSRNHPDDFSDSGAIMVGGSTWQYPYSPSVVGTQGTSVGSRVDCFAWAENVRTCGIDLTGQDVYTNFGGTSSAAAIVAGAVLLVQGVAQVKLGRRLSPREMRALLSNDLINTRSASYGVDRIGVMPNLKSILQDLGVAPDVYMRDYLGDTGDLHAGAVSLSPDIIVRPAPVASPGVTFGPGTESDMMLGPTATSGQDNSVYVRVWNRGSIPATNVKATVFYASAGTLLTPIDWQPVGSVLIANVPENNVMTVSPAITWPMAKVPPPGHYCFIALVGNAQDPAPDPVALLNFDNYLAYIRSNNNVTWRNFDVVTAAAPSAPGGAGDAFNFAFAAPGAPDSDRYFAFAVGSRLPPGSHVTLEAPLSLLGDRFPFVEADTARQRGRVPIAPHGRTTLPSVVFPAKSRSQCRLLVHLPRGYRARGDEVYVSQVYDGFEVGRVTWRIVDKV